MHCEKAANPILMSMMLPVGVAVTALSEKSVANRSQAVEFPDFTKGKWKSTPPLTIMGV